jgi:plastocyanin
MKQRNFLTTVLVLSVLFFSCSKDKSSLAQSDNGTIHATGNGTTPGNSAINYTTRVSIQNSAFTPADVTVMVGGSILWVNTDSEQVHTVTADDGSFDSGDIQPGGTFGFTFNTVGPYPYHCKYHKEMTGIVKCVTK